MSFHVVVEDASHGVSPIVAQPDDDQNVQGGGSGCASRQASPSPSPPPPETLRFVTGNPRICVTSGTLHLYRVDGRNTNYVASPIGGGGAGVPPSNDRSPPAPPDAAAAAAVAVAFTAVSTLRSFGFDGCLGGAGQRGRGGGR